jgi:hypothetical protein
MYRTLHKQRKDRAIDMFSGIKNVLRNKGYDTEDFFYIFPMGNYGEHTYVLGHLPALRTRGKVCLVLTESKSWLTEFFAESFDFCITIADGLSSYYEELFEISYLSKGFPYIVWTDIFGNGRLNSELIRQGRLTLAESYAFALELPLSSMPRALKIAERNSRFPGAKKNHVLLMPDATTVRKLDINFWLYLYEKLESQFLNPIFDNTFSKWDVKNIRTVDIIKRDLIHFFDCNCAAIIGIRSGILDLIGGYASENLDKKVITLMPVDSDFYDVGNTGLNVVGISKYAGVFPCWKAMNIIDLEIDLRNKRYEIDSTSKILKAITST